jgi:hypothetical protein
MNEVKIDKLFHDKIATYEVQPSIDAWNKIGTRIQNKRGGSKYWLYAVAASLVLILTSVFIWTNPDNGSELIQAVNNIPETGIHNPIDNAISSVNETAAISEQENTVNQKREIKRSTFSSKENIEDSEFANTDITEYPNTYSTSLNVTFVKQGPELNLISDQFIPDFKFIPIENTDLTLPKDKTGIKKAYDYAMRVKNGEENPINLRKAKNDLFAMAKNIKFNQSKSD